MRQESDRQLTRRMQRGDAAAFTEFVDRYGARVQALARRVSCCDADAEDLTQEIFIDLCRGIGSFRGDAALKTWVYRIAWNHCAKHTARKRPETLPFEELPLIDTRQDPERMAVQQELGRRVAIAMNQLTDAHREVVTLHEMHGLTYAECAKVIGVPVGTVKSRLFNAFGKLRERLAAYVQNEDSMEEKEIPERLPIMTGGKP